MTQIAELDELFKMEEGVKDEPKAKSVKKRSQKGKEASAKSDSDEAPAGEVDSGDPAGNEPNDEAVRRATEQPDSTEPAPRRSVIQREEPAVEAWHSNIIGEPTGRPNPYFQGVVAFDGFSGGQVLIPFSDIQYAQRQIYVDDIRLENPTIMETIYRIQGTFLNVMARVTEDIFNQVITHPDIKLKKVSYSWVSDHCKPQRNYVIKHNGRPTLEELNKIDKHQDEVEWALKPWGEKERLKKQDTKYQDMPKDEEIPLPADIEADTETESEPEKLQEE